jgi:hypothetical protein
MPRDRKTETEARVQTGERRRHCREDLAAVVSFTEGLRHQAGEHATTAVRGHDREARDGSGGEPDIAGHRQIDPIGGERADAVLAVVSSGQVVIGDSVVGDAWSGQRGDTSRRVGAIVGVGGPELEWHTS